LRGVLAGSDLETVIGFVETPGRGMAGRVVGQEVCVGSGAWLASRGVALLPGANETPAASRVHVSFDGVHRGWFELAGAVRSDMGPLLKDLAADYELALLSGDNDRDRERFACLFGPSATLHFNQSPLDKLAFVSRLQEIGKRVVMIGDGLNDAGALKQSDVGVAVVENIGALSPASDVILPANLVSQIGRITRFAKASVRVVRASFLISAVYNVVGISIAARGSLSPVVCAVLMPLSSVSVVAFACLVTRWLSRRILDGARPEAGQIPVEEAT
jgi:Cu+-exporting ATPase